MLAEHGIAMLQGMAGSAGGYWARTLDGDNHSALLLALRHRGERALGGSDVQRAPRDARSPATFVSVDVCEIIGQRVGLQ